jgi:hypothetical protein
VYSYPLSENLPDGEWEVYSILVTDNAKNITHLSYGDIQKELGQRFTFKVDGEHREVNREYKNCRRKRMYHLNRN